MPIGPDLSIVIVNWRSSGFLEKCLLSIRANPANSAFEIVVIDNASFDGCAELLKKDFPEVKFIQAQENVGFARANNQAFRLTTGRNILFLNPDTEIVGDALSTLARVADAISNVGALGPKLLETDGSLQHSVWAFPCILNQSLDAEYLRTRFPKSFLWGMKALFDEERSPKPVDVISGACLLVPRAVFETVGGFTESYFMYAEDVDLCYKIKRGGFERYFVPEAVVVHHGGRSSGKTSEENFASILQRESRLRFFRGTRGALYANAYRLATGVVAILRLLLIFLGTVIPGTGARKMQLKASGRKWRAIFCWFIGLESWAKRPNH